VINNTWFCKVATATGAAATATATAATAPSLFIIGRRCSKAPLRCNCNQHAATLCSTALGCESS